MLDRGGDSIAPFTPEEKYTGYTYEGKEIVAIKHNGRPKRYNNPAFFDQERKIEAATLYCVYGDFEEVSRLAEVPVPILRQWRDEPWWVEIQRTIFTEQNDKLSGRISQVLTKAIDEIADRLDNGDTTYNPKTGAITRKPIEAKVLASLFDSLSHQRRITRGEPTAISARIGVDDRLGKLEAAFIRFASARDVTPDASAKETTHEKETGLQEPYSYKAGEQGQVYSSEETDREDYC